MEKTYAYKVVLKKETGNYVSQFTTHPDLCLEYKIGEITTPKIGKIFVYKSFDDAYNNVFFTCFDVMKVEIIGNIFNSRAILSVCDEETKLQYVKLFWDTCKNEDGSESSPDVYWWQGKSELVLPMVDYKHWYSSPAPKNYYLADAVLPIEIIK